MNKTKTFLKVLLILAISLLIFGCTAEDNNEGEGILTIQNHSDETFLRVEWRSTSFGDIPSGGEVTKQVNGDDFDVPICFYLSEQPHQCFTKEDITVHKDAHVTFEFLNSTVYETYE